MLKINRKRKLPLVSCHWMKTMWVIACSQLWGRFIFVIMVFFYIYILGILIWLSNSWKEGDSLGAGEGGITAPIRAVIRQNRKGLGS